MATLLEMAKEIVTAHAQTTPMTTTELISEIQMVHAVLLALESGMSVESESMPAADATTLTIKQAFKTNEVLCMICGKGGMKTLTRHLNQAHQLKPAQYRKQFNIPKSQSLMSKKYAEARKEIASRMDLGANLEKARAARKSVIKKGKK